jgi:hypothetical protein
VKHLLGTTCPVSAVLRERFRDIAEGQLLNMKDAMLCSTIHQVPAAQALERVRNLGSVAAVLISRALEQALNGRADVLYALAQRRMEIEEQIIAHANHTPEQMAPLAASGVKGGAA